VSCSVLRGRKVQSESCWDLSRALPEEGDGDRGDIYIYICMYICISLFIYIHIGVDELFCA